MSRITESLYRINGVELNEGYSGYVGHLSTRQMIDFLSTHTELTQEQLASWTRDQLQDFIEDVEDWSEKDLEDLANYDNSELTEARNPKNDAANTAIKKWATKRGQRSLTQADKKALKDKNIEFEDNAFEVSGNGNSFTKDDIKTLHPDYDIVGKLNSNREINRNNSDKEFPTNSFRDTYNYFGMMDKPNPHDTSKMSSNQFQSLQPYNIEKGKLKDYKRWERDAEDRVERARQELEDQKKRTANFMDEVRARRAARKNESLNLNESKEGLMDYFYQMVSAYDMDYDEQVDYLLCYINESDLADAISDFKDYMGIDE